MKEKLRYYLSIAKWIYQHRAEPDNRQKWRRMQKEIRNA